MKLEEIAFRNIGPYGNKFQNIKFEKEGSLNLIVGKNGHGKCVHPDTMITIKFEDPDIQKQFEEYTKGKY